MMPFVGMLSEADLAEVPAEGCWVLLLMLRVAWASAYNPAARNEPCLLCAMRVP